MLADNQDTIIDQYDESLGFEDVDHDESGEDDFFVDESEVVDPIDGD